MPSILTTIRSLFRTGLGNTRSELHRSLDETNFVPVGEALGMHIDWLRCRITMLDSEFQDFLTFINHHQQPLTRQAVYFKENQYLLYSESFSNEQSTLTVAIGDDVAPSNNNAITQQMLTKYLTDVCGTRCTHDEFQQLCLQLTLEIIASMATCSRMHAMIGVYLDTLRYLLESFQEHDLLASYTEISVLLNMTGDYCSTLRPGTLLGTIYYLHRSLKAKFLRLDLAIDDFAKKLSLGDIYGAIANDNKKGFKKYKLVQEGEGEKCYSTIYCGARSSPIMMRIYETAGKHEDLDTIRVEYELKKEAVRQLIPQICATMDSISDDLDRPSKRVEMVYQNLLVQLLPRISFIDKSSNKNLSRCKTLPFWQQFMMRFCLDSEGYTYRRSYPEPSLIRTKNWLIRQCSKTLFKLSKVIGRENLNRLKLEMLEHGCTKMRSRDWKQLDDYLHGCNDLHICDVALNSMSHVAVS